MHTIRLCASRAKALGWRDYNTQFRLKKECNPNMTITVVDQELWLLYKYSPLTLQGSETPTTLGAMNSKINVSGTKVFGKTRISAFCFH